MSKLSSAAMSALLNPAGSIAASKTITGVAASGGVVTVTASSHGYVSGDVLVHESIGGATEANGIVVVDSAPTGNTYTIRGLSAVTNYTSGGTAKKLTFTAGLVRALTPNNIDDLRDALNRVPNAPTSTLLSIFTEGRVF